MVSFLGGGVPLDLRFRGPLEAKSFVRAPKIDPPGAQGRVFDLKCRSCGCVRRCTTYGRILDFSFCGTLESVSRVNSLRLRPLSRLSLRTISGFDIFLLETFTAYRSIASFNWLREI